MHEPEPELRELYSFSNHSCQVKGKGTVYVEELDAFIPDVYYIPTATSNLLSQCHLSRMLKFQVHHLEKASYIVKDGDIVAETILIGGVYYLKPKPKTQTQASMQTPKRERTGPDRDAPERDPVAIPKAPKANKNRIGKQVAQSKPEVPHKNVNVENSLTGKPLHSRCIHKWHRRLGHASFRVLRKMPEFAKVTDIWTHPIRPITVMEDNESVIYISESHFTGSRSRHIDIRYQNIKHLVKKRFCQNAICIYT
ncbi:uncharacterized protein LOC132710181 [Pantherophis guttatus]|uniref:Uncharacterized protein LOC132710181 n=1 Tax=Pantherophis guttatus TaxID=94885 RepID=A0ABM3Z0B3_PANGU|nr:uncharacterized protein LOC132710181 [Pantherophis guttatus]